MPHRPLRHFALVPVLLLLVSACTAGVPSRSPNGSSGGEQPAASAVATAAPSALDAARAELDHAVQRLEAIHPDPYHAVDRAAFVGELEALKRHLPELSQEEAAVGLMRAWALLSRERDGHQFALPLDDESDPILPIRVYEFADGVFVTDAMPPYEDLVGSRITALGGSEIDEVLALLEPLVPRDGPATVAAFRPLFLLHATVLRGLGLVGDGPVAVSLDGPAGRREASLEPVPSAAFREWAGWLPFTGLPPRDGLRYTQPADANLTVVLLDATTVYARYRQVQRVDDAVLQELVELAGEPSVRRVIVDVRQNPGGDNFTYPPLVSALMDDAVDRPGRLVLLTDRVTFSAAANFATEVEQSTTATFAGEPMGGGLNFWNDVDWITLPDFVLPMRLAISTRYWQKSTPDDPRLSIDPAVALPVLSSDYFSGRDPVLAAVMGSGGP